MSAPKRIRLSRAKGWRKPEGAIVVARPSRWGNPYTLGAYADDYPDHSEASWRRIAVSDFRAVLSGRFEWDDPETTYPSVDEIRAELAGHDLACWCPLDQPCHADVLLELANQEAVDGH